MRVVHHRGGTLRGRVRVRVEELGCRQKLVYALGGIHQAADAPAEFEKMEGYDDGITYRLVGAASELLEIPAEQVTDEPEANFTLYFLSELGIALFVDGEPAGVGQGIPPGSTLTRLQ